MEMLTGMKNVAKGLFVHRLEKNLGIETRQQRQKRVRDKRMKQWQDSLLSVGAGYHKWQGWSK